MKHILIFALILLFVSPLVAQEDWKTKDFDKWDRQDVETILNNSAWVKKTGSPAASRSIAAGIGERCAARYFLCPDRRQRNRRHGNINARH